jgi:hypothetical protein
MESCVRCADGCAECASDCFCLDCVLDDKTAPNCACGADETWSWTAMRCDGEVAPESEDDDGTSTENSSANVMKFFVSALVALIAFL